MAVGKKEWERSEIRTGRQEQDLTLEVTAAHAEQTRQKMAETPIECVLRASNLLHYVCLKSFLCS